MNDAVAIVKWCIDEGNQCAAKPDGIIGDSLLSGSTCTEWIHKR